MVIIKNFSVFKSKPSENDKLPTHILSTKIGEDYVTIGSAWTKDSTNGKYLSAKLQDAWVSTEDKTKSRRSLVIVFEDDLIELQRLAKVEDSKVIDPKDGRDVTPDESNPF